LLLSSVDPPPESPVTDGALFVLGDGAAEKQAAGDRDEQRPERFQVGQKLDAMVIGFDRSKKPNFSVKARQISEEKEAVAQYGSSDSGASASSTPTSSSPAKLSGSITVFAAASLGAHVLTRMRAGQDRFPGIIGFGNTVLPPRRSTTESEIEKDISV